MRSWRTIHLVVGPAVIMTCILLSCTTPSCNIHHPPVTFTTLLLCSPPSCHVQHPRPGTTVRLAVADELKDAAAARLAVVTSNLDRGLGPLGAHVPPALRRLGPVRGDVLRIGMSHPDEQILLRGINVADNHDDDDDKGGSGDNCDDDVDSLADEQLLVPAMLDTDTNRAPPVTSALGSLQGTTTPPARERNHRGLSVQSRRFYHCHISERAAAHDSAYLGRVRLRLADTCTRDTNASQWQFSVVESRKVIDDRVAAVRAGKQDAYEAIKRMRALKAVPKHKGMHSKHMNTLQNNPSPSTPS